MDGAADSTGARKGERNLRDLGEAAAPGHHDLELLERDEAVAVLAATISAADARGRGRWGGAVK